MKLLPSKLLFVLSHIAKGLLLFLLAVSVLSGCSNTKKPPYITRSSFQLDTQITINLYDKQDQKILDECFELISKYESIYSAAAENSELYALNQGTAPHTGLTYQISDELSDLLKYGLYYCNLSGGAFDISVEPLTSLWNFDSPDHKVPSDQDIKNALSYVNYKNIQLSGNEVTFLKPGVKIDLGGIAKGYIADRLKDYLIKNGVNSAIINLGGNVLCVGSKPDGTPFKVGIQKPFADRNETAALMDITDRSVVSSGIYERYFISDNVLYHHILNPQTGYPYDSDLISTTIITKASVDGDGLSTTTFALGLEKGMALINSLPDTYAAFITKDYKVYYSNGFKEAFHVVEQ
jgi:thiamine biosynthesis lipoprotein